MAEKNNEISTMWKRVNDQCHICTVDSDGDSEREEVTEVKKVKNVYLPSHEEIEEHNINHLPFRDWCPYCVKGKGVSAAHSKRKREETQVPVIAIDYMGLERREPGEGENPIIVLTERKYKNKFAHVVKNKGAEDYYAVERIAQELVNLGYSHFVFKSDQEPAILSFKAAVIRRVTALKGDGVTIVPEVSPVGESQSNGDIESAIKQIQGHFRTLRLQLQARYKELIPEDHSILAWLVQHSGYTLNRYLKGPDGRTPRQRLKGRMFNKECAEFGECVWYLQPKSAGKHKLSTRWGEGIWIGIKEESGEVLIGTTEGVIKVRTVRRKPEVNKWNVEMFKGMKGLPWEPVPGRDSNEPPICIKVPEEDNEIVKPVEENKREFAKNGASE